jgi:hypothetical protein
MLTLVIIIVVLGLVIVGLVKLIDKFVKPKLRPVVSIVLWGVTILFAYLIYMSIQAPIKFDKIKEARYKVAVNRMIDIKAVQLAYKSIKGKYTDNMDSIVKFVENDYFIILERKDSSVVDVERNKAYGITSGYFKDIVVTKEIGRVKVKDSLFKDSDRYKRLNMVKVDGISTQIDMKADYVIRNNTKVPVFLAKLEKISLLTDQDPDLIAKEKTVKSVEAIDGEFITLGSIEEVNMTGNWPKKYGNNE